MGIHLKVIKITIIIINIEHFTLCYPVTSILHILILTTAPWRSYFYPTLPLSIELTNLLHIKYDNIDIHKSEGKVRASFKYLKIEIKSCDSIENHKYKFHIRSYMFLVLMYFGVSGRGAYLILPQVYFLRESTWFLNSYAHPLIHSIVGHSVIRLKKKKLCGGKGVKSGSEFRGEQPTPSFPRSAVYFLLLSLGANKKQEI